jgi:hypothetical protein
MADCHTDIAQPSSAQGTNYKYYIVADLRIANAACMYGFHEAITNYCMRV